MNTFLQALALFLPILAANQGPGLARRFNFPLGHTPVWVRILGPNKTVAAYYMGPLCAVLVTAAVLLIKSSPDWWYVGPALGLGAVLGDHVKSAVKRQLLIKPGDPWFFDRIDFAIGGGLAAYLCIEWATLLHVVWIVAIAYPVHYIGNTISYELDLRDTPH